MTPARKGRCLIGTSGWVYPHWRGVFYPPGLPTSHWFAHYTRSFTTVELNNTFYVLPSEKAFHAWREQAPPGFSYAVKANRYITHMKKLKDFETPLSRFLERARLLGEALGPVLYQLPPGWRADLGRLEAFLSGLPADLLSVFEFRDRSWLVESVFELLARYGICFCVISLPDFPCPHLLTGRAAYLRFHGPQWGYSGSYSRDELREWAGKIQGWLEGGFDVYAYFNNDVGGHAVHNALELRELVGA